MGVGVAVHVPVLALRVSFWVGVPEIAGAAVLTGATGAGGVVPVPPGKPPPVGPSYPALAVQG